MIKTCDKRKEIEQKEKKWQDEVRKKEATARYNSIKKNTQKDLRFL